MNNSVINDRSAALHPVRIRPSVRMALSRVLDTDRPAVTDTGLPIVSLLTCQQSAVLSYQLVQVGRTHGVSNISGFGAKGIGMANTLGAVESTETKASGVPPRGRPV